MENVREQLAYIGRMLFERRLTDTAGGNISARQGNRIFISPKYSGSKRHWQLDPEEFIEGEIGSNEVLNHPMFSREGKTHVAIYLNFPDVQGVIHAHPFHILPFCAAGKTIEPMLEQTQKFGVIQLVKAAPAHSAELAENIVAGLRGQEKAIQTQAAAVLVPQHGIIVAGRDILAAVDALERIDWNAWCILAQRLLE
jgi:L-fuculose-phosphate aldolase